MKHRGARGRSSPVRYAISILLIMFALLLYVHYRSVHTLLNKKSIAALSTLTEPNLPLSSESDTVTIREVAFQPLQPSETVTVNPTSRVIEKVYNSPPVVESKKSTMEAETTRTSFKSLILPAHAMRPVPYRLNTSQFSERQKRVIDGIRHAFDSYRRFAWGHDELLPMERTYMDWGSEKRTSGRTGIGLTAIESLDTLWLTGQYDLFNVVVDYLSADNQHTFDLDLEVGIFETTIRVLGGLLSAYELSSEPILLEKAVDIGNRLFKCIEGREIPYATVNLQTGVPSNPRWLDGLQSLSEVTTIQLEFKKLSWLTGDPKYGAAVTAVMKKILSFSDSLHTGLFPIFIHAVQGEPQYSGRVTLGARGDSFYEYLVKQWVLTGKQEEWLRAAYEKTSTGILKHLLKQVDDKHAYIVEAEGVAASTTESKMDHLVCFVVGMLQLGKSAVAEEKVHDKAAGDIARTCYQIYNRNPTHLGTEIVRFTADHQMYPSKGAFHYIMRPEVMEGFFYMSRFHPEEYKEWSDLGWSLFEAMEKYLKVENGWTGLTDATILNSARTKKMESFFVAETLKYAFLIAADDPKIAQTQVPLDEWVFNTEAHPLRVVHLASLKV